MIEIHHDDLITACSHYHGSQSDWPIMRAAAAVLDEPAFCLRRRASFPPTVKRPTGFMLSLKPPARRASGDRCGTAGGAAHLPGMTAALTTLPVLGVPIPTTALSGLDALYSIVQMPAGVPVGTLAIGEPAALEMPACLPKILALGDPGLAARVDASRAGRTAKVAERPDQ